MPARCFACDRRIAKGPKLVACGPDPVMIAYDLACGSDPVTYGYVHVDPDCYGMIEAAGAEGYQPRRNGARLYLLQFTKHAEMVR